MSFKRPRAVSKNQGEKKTYCRTCASTGRSFIPIFPPDKSRQFNYYNLFEIISKYLPIKISKRDKLPLQVCKKCYTTLKDWDNLFGDVHFAERRLRTILFPKHSLRDKKGKFLATALAAPLKTYNAKSRIKVRDLSEIQCSSASAIPEQDKVNPENAPIPSKSYESPIDSHIPPPIVEDDLPKLSNTLFLSKDKIIETSPEEKEPKKPLMKLPKNETYVFMPKRSSRNQSHFEKSDEVDSMTCAECGSMGQPFSSVPGFNNDFVYCRQCDKVFPKTTSKQKRKPITIMEFENCLPPEAPETVSAAEPPVTTEPKIKDGEKMEGIEVNGPSVCPMCAATFDNSESFREHIKTTHKRIGLFCYYCAKSYRSRTALIRHIKKHTGDNFNCTSCSKTYNNGDEFKDHFQTCVPLTDSAL